ncbi:tRNA uridine-5-carboxymethylaminomethyl(34) synthesis GTPase MnmE [Aurantiacibacter spongiae]|uniref:tRNA modification GTPase MnmE n=1 Tax=Aurantiacibacter spongiae TaxID=2488860 RepID=A0A3N5CVA2_9SPHN|nr:tRNA uridine-5-carboxymethylaminomethyl(34) synthesis GTPase MnmE [Aurantiacibacter spongiae]RPF71390.1 tRNA uridine-5-carboxymethylaminomethyl(34) synthesis GTPase MnmE [Aurantiacibacter spongiae]
MTTIFALSSGSPPAGIAVIRITGPDAFRAVDAVAGHRPEPRMATLTKFKDAHGNPLDTGLVILFPGPHSVTGEDVAEFHCHGGRAVIAAIESALAKVPNCRRAEAGEFTRRAFANGQLDLAEAEGLADLLSAETELQRRSALAMAGGALTREVEDWRRRLLQLSAQVEAALDFDEEDEVRHLPDEFKRSVQALLDDIRNVLDQPRAELLREGYRIALAGPPNVGKSTLFNALLESEAAITSDIAGTTRDVLVRSVAMRGIPMTFVDMAGLRTSGTDEIENIGIVRAREEMERADLVLWLGPEGEGPLGAWEVDARSDDPGRTPKKRPDSRVSARTGDGMNDLRRAIMETAQNAMPNPGAMAINRRQEQRLNEAHSALAGAIGMDDLLLVAESLREARIAFDGLIGRTSTEDVLDTIFGRFCIGK